MSASVFFRGAFAAPPTLDAPPAGDARALAECRSRLLMTVAALTGVGLVMVYSASSAKAAQGGGWDMSYGWTQLRWLGVALAGYFMASRFPYRWLARLWLPVLAATYGLLGLVLVPGVGVQVGGAYRWFRFAGMQMQPSELAKGGMIVVIAALLARVEQPRFFRHVLFMLALIGGAVALVLLEPDIGTAALLGAVLAMMLLVGRARLLPLLATGLALAVPMAVVALTRFDHVRARIDDWLAGDGFHTNASVTAIASGGVWGVGLGQGPAKLFFLPEAHNDFIFAIVGQELGFVGAAAVVACFGVFLWQGLGIARHAPDRFGALLAFGVTMIVAMQAAFNMGVVTGLLPPKGISLPFISFGGSGLCVNFALVGLLSAVATQRPVSATVDNDAPRADTEPFTRVRSSVG